MKKLISPLFWLILITIMSCTSQKFQKSEFDSLKQWLSQKEAKKEDLSQQKFAKKPLTKKQADDIIQIILGEKEKTLLERFGEQWEDRKLKLNNLKMPFFLKIFGEKPADGRSLFISLHGGGGAPPYINNQQYENQKHLYDNTMNQLEGVYLAPRAPSNTWDLWHQNHIDDFLNIIIQLAVSKLDINPNKIYLMGYSAGGDGVYQLAPRMADRFAAAAMMAGHPNESSPIGLRNLPFTIHIGALDKAYNRNKVAKEWGLKLDSLQKNDENGYIHFVKLHQGKGHWMNLEDAEALFWLKKHRRNPLPDKIVWKQDNRHHSKFYWLDVPEKSIKTGNEAIVSLKKSTNEILILKNDYDTLNICLNDQMMNLDKDITVKFQENILGRIFPTRTVSNIYQDIQLKNDKDLVFPAKISIINNKVIF